MTNREKRMRQVRRQKRILALCLLLIAIIGGISVCRAVDKKAEEKKEAEAAEIAEKEEKKKEEKKKQEEAERKILPEVKVDLEQLNSSYAVLAELETGKVLAEKNSDQQIYPASMTKIMTTLVAIENIKDLDEKVMYPHSLYEELLEEHASFAGFEPDEEVKVKDLLYGAILPSGAECCRLLADVAAGSEEAFVEKMNEKAEELGMENTYFINTTGFHDDQHYTTVSDMMLLLTNALQNEMFYKIFTASEYTGSPSNSHPNGTEFSSRVFDALDDLQISDKVTGGRILGGKTGYTDNAGVCLASLGEVGGNKYILVTAKADKPDETAWLNVKDAMDVYNQIGEYLEKK